MDRHVVEYYSAYSDTSPHGHFHRVIPLHGLSPLSWSDASRLVPHLCRGWYELAQLPLQDRIEFTREFWLAKLPYHPPLNEFLMKFFVGLDDIGIFLTQQRYEDPFEAHLVYSLAGNSGFFHGEIPAKDEEIIELKKLFPGCILPADYLAFLQIHNGFAKLTDTGITPSSRMRDTYEAFLNIVGWRETITTTSGDLVNPTSLIPFYESFGMPFFQCFWRDWYPAQEMGNVYYAGLTGIISTSKRKGDALETMAFETFADWLMFYLERID